MAFDWRQFLTTHNIEYVSSGKSTTKDNVNIRCPLCGPADEGHHMGISLKGRGWHCWRNPSHAGKSRVRLIQLLLGCDADAARSLAQLEARDMPDTRDMISRVRERLGAPALIQRRLMLRPEFKRLIPGSVFGRPFWQYLRERGYRDAQVKWIVDTYGLMFARDGNFAQRVIIPIYNRRGELLTWVGRSIRRKEQLRYKALSMRSGALCQPQEALLGLPYLWKCEDPQVLVVTEGFFDALRVTVFGRAFGVYGTCLFGLNISGEQIGQLNALDERFARKVLLVDPDAKLKALQIAHAGAGLEIVNMPSGFEDPAVLPPEVMTTVAFRLRG